MARTNKEPRPEIYRLSLTDDKTHRQLWAFSFSRFGFLATVVTILFVLTAAIASIISFTPLKTLLPGYPDAHTRQEAIRNAIRIDSLEGVVNRWDLYAENLARVVDGKQPLKMDSVLKAGATKVTELDGSYLAKRDSLLRANVLEESHFRITGESERDLPIEGVHFFVPVKGVISEGFDKASRPGIDITSAEGSMVTAVLDGTVVYTGWNEKEEYIIEIQHSNDILSIYRLNLRLLKNTGDRVRAGSPVAIAGSLLRFELWYKGEAVDPAKYINF